MHDIDRAMFEMDYREAEGGPYAGSPSGEASEFELTAELLEITSEAELEGFLGSLISSAGRALSGFANSATGQALGGILKSAARSALPQIGRIAGDAVGMGAAGAKAGQWLGNRFEMEGLSAEDREFEVARSYVRFAQDAARQAFEAEGSAPAAAVAQQAAAAAAQRHMPALAPRLQAARPAGGGHGFSGAASGTWIRRGNRIVILGL